VTISAFRAGRLRNWQQRRKERFSASPINVLRHPGVAWQPRRTRLARPCCRCSCQRDAEGEDKETASLAEAMESLDNRREGAPFKSAEMLECAKGQGDDAAPAHGNY
jgi:hypothetical protein